MIRNYFKTAWTLQQKNIIKTKAFSNRKVSVDEAIKVLRQRGTEVSEDEAIVILDFLYLLAKNYKLSEI